MGPRQTSRSLSTSLVAFLEDGDHLIAAGVGYSLTSPFSLAKVANPAEQSAQESLILQLKGDRPISRSGCSSVVDQSLPLLLDVSPDDAGQLGGGIRINDRDLPLGQRYPAWLVRDPERAATHGTPDDDGEVGSLLVTVFFLTPDPQCGVTALCLQRKADIGFLPQFVPQLGE